jgi:hypothetical protein
LFRKIAENLPGRVHLPLRVANQMALIVQMHTTK